jgi:hypothetical protein
MRRYQGFEHTEKGPGMRHKKTALCKPWRETSEEPTLLTHFLTFSTSRTVREYMLVI